MLREWRDAFLRLSIEARQRYAEKIDCPPTPDNRIWELPRIDPIYLSLPSRGEIIRFAKDHEIRTYEYLCKVLKDYASPTTPTLQHIYIQFGGWGGLRRELMRDLTYWNRPKSMTDEELIIYCSRFHIRSERHYLQLQKRLGEDVLPSKHYIMKRFGKWSLFYICLLSYDVDYQLDRYFMESLRRGRPLTLGECDHMGIEVRYLQHVFTEKIFRKLLNMKERLYREEHPESFLRKHRRSIYARIKEQKPVRLRRVEVRPNEDPTGSDR